jgi:acetolactate synthase I/II/III large subunit
MRLEKKMKASDLFIRCLENEGVEYIFGIPGEEDLDVMDWMIGNSIKFVTTRHEQGATFMADVYGRLTGKASFCLATLGPGATNLVTGFADANMDRAPIIGIAGQGATTRMHKESHQVLDLVSLFAPFLNIVFKFENLKLSEKRSKRRKPKNQVVVLSIFPKMLLR